MSQESPNLDPVSLSVEQMRDTIFANGWVHVEHDGIELFKRSYARVNEALEGGLQWRNTVLDFATVLHEQAPDVSGGIVLGMSGGETEVEVQLHGDQNNWHDVAQAFVMDTHLREHGFEEVDEGRLFDWLKLKGEPGAPRPGTREYYEQHPRSATLRELCLRVINNYVDVVVAEGAEGEAMSRLVELNQGLAELAVEPDMHAEAKPVDFVDPVVRAERIAGILRSDLHEGRGFTGNARAFIGEYDILAGEGGSIRAIEFGVNEQASKTAFFLMRLTGLAEHLGVETESR